MSSVASHHIHPPPSVYVHLISGTLHPTPLPVLSNTEHHTLWRKAALDKFTGKVTAHEEWPVHKDISDLPRKRLSSCKPLWCNLQPIYINRQWRENRMSASVVNCRLVTDPTIQLPGSDLPHQQWSQLNHLHTAQGHCGTCRKKWRLSDNEMCTCSKI